LRRLSRQVRSSKSKCRPRGRTPRHSHERSDVPGACRHRNSRRSGSCRCRVIRKTDSGVCFYCRAGGQRGAPPTRSTAPRVTCPTSAATPKFLPLRVRCSSSRGAAAAQRTCSNTPAERHAVAARLSLVTLDRLHGDYGLDSPGHWWRRRPQRPELRRIGRADFAA
jgi:hypothetical protein